MSAHGDPGVGAAAEALRAVRAGLPADAEPVDDSIKSAIDVIVDLIERPTTTELEPHLRAAAHEVRLLGTQMTAAREAATDAIGHALAAEADQIETLLRTPDNTDGDDSVTLAPPPGEPSGSPAPGGLGGVGEPAEPPAPPSDLVSTAEEAKRVAQNLPDNATVHRAINQTVAQFPPKLQELARRLLRGASSHAVQRHGHHLNQGHLLARLQWLLDPAGQDSWQPNPDGSITSRRSRNGKPHQVGTTAGHYTSAEAAAKPLIAVLAAAGRTQATLDAYLDTKAKGRTITRLFLRPADTGIAPPDVSCLRAPGTDTKPGAQLWIKTRNSANDGFGGAPAVRDYDLVTSGTRPGSLMIFARAGHSWRLVTSYFHDGHDNELDYTEL